MDQPPLKDCALLAPVPLEHLKSGQKKVASEGRVAFGSKVLKPFRDLDKLRHYKVPVDVYIYASEDPDVQSEVCEVSWSALYVNSVSSANGKHPEGMKYRPESTVDDTDSAVFWELTDLKLLPERIPLAQLTSFLTKKKYPAAFPPRQPRLIMHPTK